MQTTELRSLSQDTTSRRSSVDEVCQYLKSLKGRCLRDDYKIVHTPYETADSLGWSTRSAIGLRIAWRGSWSTSKGEESRRAQPGPVLMDRYCGGRHRGWKERGQSLTHIQCDRRCSRMCRDPVPKVHRRCDHGSQSSSGMGISRSDGRKSEALGLDRTFNSSTSTSTEPTRPAAPQPPEAQPSAPPAPRQRPAPARVPPSGHAGESLFEDEIALTGAQTASHRARPAFHRIRPLSSPPPRLAAPTVHLTRVAISLRLHRLCIQLVAGTHLFYVNHISCKVGTSEARTWTQIQSASTQSQRVSTINCSTCSSTARQGTITRQISDEVETETATRVCADEERPVCLLGLAATTLQWPTTFSPGRVSHPPRNGLSALSRGGGRARSWLLPSRSAHVGGRTA